MHDRSAEDQVSTPVAFKQHDLTRAIKANLAAGLTIRATRVDPDGTIHVLTDCGPSTVPAPDPLEAWKATKRAKV